VRYLLTLMLLCPLFTFAGCKSAPSPPIDTGAIVQDIQEIREIVKALPDQSGLDLVHKRLDESEDILAAVTEAPEEDKIKVLSDKLLPLVPEPYGSYAALALGIWAILERRKRLTAPTT